MPLNDCNLLRIITRLWRQRWILGQLVMRDVLLRYRGAMFGMMWILLGPLLMLAIFAFIFGEIFQARWPQQQSGLPYWVLLYAGLIAFNIFAETINRASTAVRGYPNFVKKMIFPVEILPLVPLGTALIHAGFNLLVLAGVLAWLGKLDVSFLLLPLLLLPLLLFALGAAWFIAAWGVFIKDMSQIVPLLVQMLLFLSPVFYPVQAVPASLQPLYRHNPLGTVIETCRCVIGGQPVDWLTWTGMLLLSAVIMLLGYVFFQHSREEFADVL
ncbi:MAG: ABC transporter permease [Methylophilaceae bacterium]|nr:ABC transporter permease [Methylophilaceae bacterium]